MRAVSWTLLRVPGNGWEGFTPHVDLRGSARDGGPATTRAADETLVLPEPLRLRFLISQTTRTAINAAAHAAVAAYRRT